MRISEFNNSEIITAPTDTPDAASVCGRHRAGRGPAEAVRGRHTHVAQG